MGVNATQSVQNARHLLHLHRSVLPIAVQIVASGVIAVQIAAPIEALTVVRIGVQIVDLTGAQIADPTGVIAASE